MKRTYCIFTKFSLDGIISYMQFAWLLKFHNIELNFYSSSDVEQNILNWLLKNKLESYKKVIFLGINVERYIDLIDKDNVLFVNNHDKKIFTLYENVKKIVVEAPSLTILLYKKLKEIYNVKLSEEQLKLILYANDYITFTLKHSESIGLNMLFCNYSKNIIEFVNEFKYGYKGLNQKQMDIITNRYKEITVILKDLKIYENKEAELDGSKYHVISVFSESYIDEIYWYIFKKFNPDILFIVNLNKKRISIRRRSVSNINLNDIARKMLNGGGYEYSAGGSLTNEFIEFSKGLKQIWPD